MREAVGDRRLRVGSGIRAIHGLKQKVTEIQALKTGRIGTWLGKYQLELVALPQHKAGASFGADAYPVQTGWSRLGAIGLDRNDEAAGMQRGNERAIDLEQRLAAGEHYETVHSAGRPNRFDRSGQRPGSRKLACVGADEIRVTKSADSRGAVAFET